MVTSSLRPRGLVVAAGFLLALTGAAYAAELLRFGDRAGMEVTILDTSNTDTDRAHARVSFTRENAKRYCVEYRNSHAERCVDVALTTLRFPDAISADCPAATFVDLSGERLAFELDRKPRRNRDYRVVKAANGRDVLSVHDYAAALAAFRLLCPNTFADWEANPGCEAPGYEHLLKCPANMTEPQQTIGGVLRAAASIQCYVGREYSMDLTPAVPVQLPGIWTITFDGKSAWVNGNVMPVYPDPNDPSVVSLRLLDIVAPDPATVGGTMAEGQREILTQWREAASFMMARAGVDRRLAVWMETGRVFFYDQTSSGPINIVEVRCG